MTLAAIPYYTFPKIGPFNTFGLFVAAGVLVGAVVGKRHLDRTGIDGEPFYRFAWVAAVCGIVGARLAYVISNFGDYASNPLRVFALWEGGLSFSGGLVLAAVVAPFWVRRAKMPARPFLDGAALGLSVGLGVGRWGCISVGEHFGGPTKFFLGVRFLGGFGSGGAADVREPTLGDNGPTVVKNLVFHNTAVYEMLFCFALFGFLLWLRRRRPAAGTLAGVAAVVYGTGRFLLDALRLNDNRTLGLTGAQWLCIVLVGLGAWYLVRIRRVPAKDVEVPETEEQDVEVEESPPAADTPPGTAGANGAELAPAEDAEAVKASSAADDGVEEPVAQTEPRP